MQFWYKTKGAVSIFLVLILVPMMVMSSAFVDAGKVKLGYAMAESAGDLALNTALTNYDTALKDLYGLMATAQDTEDLFNKLEGYYTACITSSGVGNEYAELFVEDIMSGLGSYAEEKETADIMNMEVSTFSVQKVDNAHLANAAILKRQIVDFMKFRAPINTGLGFISSLKSFSTLKQQTKLVETKQDYYEAQQTVMEDLQAAWADIVEYNKTDIPKKTNSTSNYFETVSKNMEVFRKGGTIDSETYAGYNQEGAGKPVGLSFLTVWDIYDTSPYLGYSYECSNIDITYEAPNNSSNVENNDYPVIYRDGSRDYAYDYYCKQYADGSRSLPTTSSFKTALTNFYSQLSKVELLYDAISTKRNMAANDHELRFYVNAIRGNEGVDDYSDAVVLLYNYYQQLKAMYIWVYQYDYIEVYTEPDEDGNTTRITSSSILNEKISLGSSSNQKGEEKISTWYSVADSKYNNILMNFALVAEDFCTHASNAYDVYIESSQDAFLELSHISEKATEYKKQLTNAKTHLTNAIAHLNDAKTKLTGTVATAKQNWSNAADDSAIQDTSLAKQDQAEIEQLDKNINVDNIDKLIKRLTNVRDKISEALTEVEKYQYFGTYIGDINTDDVMAEIFGNNARQEFLKLSADKTELSAKTLYWITNNCSYGEVKYDWTGTSGYQPNLNFNKVALYSYLSSHFSSTTVASSTTTDSETPNTSVETGTAEDGENFYNDIKDVSSNADVNPAAKEENKGDVNAEAGADEISKMTDIPSKQATENGGGSTPYASDTDTNVESGAESASDNLDGILGDSFLEGVADMGEDIRDKLYICDYVMSMFSYDTIEKEYEKKNGKAPVAGDLQTLTKCDISADNNYAYTNEIEYIIYGGSYAGNSAKAYASIYGIRFGFNVVYAFATSEIRDSALAIATPISAATLGVIPAPLIQAAIIIGIACIESGLDIAEIMAGEKIPLYKTAQTWRCSITGLTNYARSKAEDAIKDIAKDASEALVNESINKLNELLDATDQEIEAKITEYGESAGKATLDVFDDLVTENANTAIQQLTTYINSAVDGALCLEDGETYEGKKAEMIQWAKDEMIAWGNQFTGDDLASVVKREAANVIVANSDLCFNQLFDTVEASILGVSTEDGETVDDIISKGTVGDEEGIVSELGGNVMDIIYQIRDKISDTVDAGTGKVQELRAEITGEIGEALNQGGAELKESVNAQIDKMFGTSSSGGSVSKDNSTATGAAAFFSFGYSDYLRLFLLIGTFTNEESILLRTADVIQVNMANCITEDTSYQLKNSAAYVKIDAELQVKPTLLALPFFADVEANPISNSNWYTITYSGVSGY